MLCPDDSSCWVGDWQPTNPVDAMWAQSAVARTVRALPELHPLRLGDDKGTSRVLVWCASAQGAGIGVLTQMAPPPALATGEPDDNPDLLVTLAAGLPHLADAVAEAVTEAVAPASARPSLIAPAEYRKAAAGVHRWAGGLARMADAWLPPVAILPRSQRGFDDPSTGWSTESVDFARRHTVHTDDVHLAANLMAPHVMALILDHVPDGAAITVSGDAVHVWWDYDAAMRLATGAVANTVAVAHALTEAFPSFVLAEYPNHSREVEDRLADKAADAASYRASRVAGTSQNPVLERIYAQAKAQYLAQRDGH
jgi:hypothetical protein